MCDLNHRPWGGNSGAECIGTGPVHAVVFVSSSLPDKHDVSEQASEATRG